MIILLIFFLFVAAVTDLHRRRVKNQWIALGLFTGLVLNTFASVFGHLHFFKTILSCPGLLSAITGFSIALPLLFLYSRHLLGAADVKLIMVAGTMIGSNALLKCLPLMVLSGGILILIYFLINLIRNKKFNIKSSIPLAPAMLLGTIAYALGITL